MTSKQEFDADKDCPGRWLWKKSQGKAYIDSEHIRLEYLSLNPRKTHFSETDPSKIGHGQPEDLRTKWGEAEEFGGKMHTANITVKAFYN